LQRIKTIAIPNITTLGLKPPSACKNSFGTAWETVCSGWVACIAVTDSWHTKLKALQVSLYQNREGKEEMADDDSNSLIYGDPCRYGYGYPWLDSKFDVTGGLAAKKRAKIADICRTGIGEKVAIVKLTKIADC
jgi:hypothetical protein